MNKFPVILMLVAVIILVLISVTVSLSMTWNDKPVLCMEKSMAEETTNSRKEILIFKGLQTTKVRSEDGLQDEMEIIPMSFYFNPTTKTYTMFEYHFNYNIYCVISQGVQRGEK